MSILPWKRWIVSRFSVLWDLFEHVCSSILFCQWICEHILLKTLDCFTIFVFLRFIWTYMFIKFLLPTDLWTFISETVELFHDFRFPEIYLNMYVHQFPFANRFVNIYLRNRWIVSWFCFFEICMNMYVHQFPFANRFVNIYLKNRWVV